MVTPAPLISACLIVKNESDYIERCLRSVADLADEIVVYDTGSTDDTIAKAEALGARVIRGYWDNDFGRARNESLAHCTGAWVVQIDADEELVADVAAFRAGLDAIAHRYDALRLEIKNVDADGLVASVHKLPRIFRRERCHWNGRLHERIERLDETAVVAIDADGAHFVHHGYTAEVIEGRDKFERNLRIAVEEVESCPDDVTPTHRALLLHNLARSHAALQHVDEVVDLCEQVVELTDGPIHRSAVRVALEVCIRAGRADAAERWFDRLEACGARADILDIFGGAVALLHDRPAPQLVGYHGHGDLFDDDGLGMNGAALDHLAAMGMASVDQWDGAADALMALATGPHRFGAWDTLAIATYKAGRPLAPVAEIVPTTDIRPMLAKLLLHADLDAVDTFAIALAEQLGPDPRLVAFAGFHAPRLDVERAVPWATVVRGHGSPERCPLLAIATDANRTTLDRFTAALTAHVAFRCAVAFDTMNDVAADLDDHDTPIAEHLLHELAPDLVATPV